MTRSKRVNLIAGFCLALFGTAAQAQVQPQALTQDQFNLYIGIGAFSACNLAIENVTSIEKAIANSANVGVGLFSSVYGGIIPGVNSGKKLTDQELYSGNFAQTVVKVQQTCFDKLNKVDQKFVNDIIVQLKASSAEVKKK